MQQSGGGIAAGRGACLNARAGERPLSSRVMMAAMMRCASDSSTRYLQAARTLALWASRCATIARIVQHSASWRWLSAAKNSEVAAVGGTRREARGWGQALSLVAASQTSARALSHMRSCRADDGSRSCQVIVRGCSRRLRLKKALQHGQDGRVVVNFGGAGEGQASMKQLNRISVQYFTLI